MNEYFIEGFEKAAGSRAAATLTAGGFGGLGGLAAEDGKGWRTAGGAMGGGLLGSLAGHSLGKGHFGTRMLGNAIGAAGGAYLAHGKDRTAKQKKARLKRLKAEG